MKTKRILVAAAVAAMAFAASAAVRLADPFADGMVLQREKPVPVWGTADPGEKVTVAFAGQSVSATADASGAWKLRLAPLPVSKDGREFVVQSDRADNRTVLRDVLVGDVWFVSGQSNCEFPLCGSNPHFSDRNGAAIASITHLPLVRFCCQSDYKISVTPKTRAGRPVVWKAFTPKNLTEGESFSAIGVYFALYVHQATGVPLGLVGAYWGGTGIDPWTPREGTATRPDLKDVLDWKPLADWDGENPKSIFPHGRKCDQPAVLWNEMVNPWCPYAMKGFLWYQGCTNSREPERYCSKMHALYNGWSKLFENPDLKLYFVQLAPWGFGGVAKIQEAQADFEREQPNAGMAVINDVGNLKDIHPNEKGTVGLRLARMALKRDYGFTDIEDRSPQLRSWRLEGDSFILDFDHAKRLFLYNRDFSAVTPFEVAGPDGVFKPAKIANLTLSVFPNGRREYRGLIRGGGRLIVKSDEVPDPVKLRYCHSEPWLGTVYNEADLPLAAFHVEAERPSADAIGFAAAVPVWPKGRETEMNCSIRFKAPFDAAAGARAVLRITGSSAYRVRLNGAYAGYGPARGPKGWFRVDEIPLSAKPQGNELEIDVACYNCDSFYLMDQPAFLQAEVLVDGKVVAATGAKGAFAAYPTDRVRKVSRYSYQRTFAEAYRVGSSADAKPLTLAEEPSVPLLKRIAPYPTFALNPLKFISRANVRANPQKTLRPYAFAGTMGRPDRKAFEPKDFEVDLRADGALVDFTDRREFRAEGSAALAPGESVMVDAGLNDCGFPGMTVEVRKPGKLLLTFDEILSDGEVNPTRMSCCNVVEWIFEKPGTYAVEAFEPYVGRYGNIFTPDGEMTVSDPHVRAYKNPDTVRAKFRAADSALEKVFAAAKETFAQNAVDVFTDCPSRERAGWLCDSFFLGRVSRVLTGSAEQERLFLQNYAIPETFDHLPKGVIPMCYPSDHPNGNFIPNWAMWLVIETEEYLKRSGDRATIDALKPRYVAFVDYLKAFRNSDGLLEKLPKWVFVEWSQANKQVQDVNYPSNMTWAEVLDVMDRLYGMPELAAEAEKVREMVRRQSWTGRWFCDNSVRQKDGSLKLSGVCTETCQYYAFLFRTATPQTHPDLWRTLVDDFGPKRIGEDGKTLKSHPEIWPSNAFIGNYLRLECLAREGLSRNIMDETKGFFLYMAERTGTLWENVGTTASCDHGFASHAAVTLYRDVLGVREIDYAAKTVRVMPPKDLQLDWCEGELPVSPTEVIRVAWKRGAEPDVVLPAGWRVK